MASLTDLCNRALAALAKGQIASLSEGSLESRECQRFAQPLLDEMISWSDQIPLGRRRTALAEVPNDRPAEWLHAYAAPSDMDMPLAIRRVEDPASDLPEGGPGPLPFQDAFPLRFLHEAGRIYCNVETATLLYAGTTLDVAELGGLMQKAFVDELAVRMAMPLTRDPKVAQALSGIAELSRARAIAHEENRLARRQTDYVSDAELARLGLLP